MVWVVYRTVWYLLSLLFVRVRHIFLWVSLVTADTPRKHMTSYIVTIHEWYIVCKAINCLNVLYPLCKNLFCHHLILLYCSGLSGEWLFFHLIQDIHKRMVWFQKLTRNLFLTLHEHNIHRQQQQMSQVSHALPAVRFSCLLWGRGASFQDGVAAGKCFMCAAFWGVQICDYSAAWVSCTV